MMNSKLVGGLVLIFVVFIVMMNYPMLQLPFSDVKEIPGILLYFLIFWIGLIIAMRLIFISKSEK